MRVCAHARVRVQTPGQRAWTLARPPAHTHRHPSSLGTARAHLGSGLKHRQPRRLLAHRCDTVQVPRRFPRDAEDRGDASAHRLAHLITGVVVAQCAAQGCGCRSWSCGDLACECWTAPAGSLSRMRHALRVPHVSSCFAASRVLPSTAQNARAVCARMRAWTSVRALACERVCVDERACVRTCTCPSASVCGAESLVVVILRILHATWVMALPAGKGGPAPSAATRTAAST